jgi:hypothetical protein
MKEIVEDVLAFATLAGLGFVILMWGAIVEAMAGI